MDEIHILKGGVVPIDTYGHSSKGNQLKWNIEDKWYKADGLGYEGLAEVLVSRLLALSSVDNFVLYEPAIIKWRGKTYNGCVSKNFLEEGWQICTVEKLFRKYTGLSMAEEIGHMSEITSRIRFMTDFVSNVTGIDDFGNYLATMVEIDSFFRNEDRHTNNISVLYNPDEKRYRLCPYYDHGASLFSDLNGDYPLEKNVEECEKIIDAKPFSRSFDEQLDAILSLYPGSLRFPCKRKGLLDEWKKIRREDELVNKSDPSRRKIYARIEKVLLAQIRKFDYTVNY